MRTNNIEYRINESKTKSIPFLPPPGLRILKTAAAVFICLLVYMARGFEGMVGESVITAILCIQPNTGDSIRTGLSRFLGTTIGAAWGLLFLLLFEQSPLFSQYILLTYAAIAIGILVSIYSTVVLKLNNTSAITAIVFYCIVSDYPNIISPLLQTRDRLTDTLIGVLIGVLINSFSLPRRQYANRVFCVHFQDLVSDRVSDMSPKVIHALSELFAHQAKICLMTRYAPALLIPQISSIPLTMPCIVMDGAAAYDVRFNSYVRMIPIPHEEAEYLGMRFSELNLAYSIFTVRNQSMMIYHQGELNIAEEKEYLVLRRSPYRNYVEGEYSHQDQILGIRLLVAVSELEALKTRLLTPDILERFAVSEQPVAEVPDHVALCFKNPKASFENMQKELMNYLHYPDRMDVYMMRDLKAMRTEQITEQESLKILKKVRSLYEPVSL